MKNVVIYILLSFSTLTAQDFLPLGTIQYSIIDGQKIAVSKTAFEYDNENRVTSSTFYNKSWQDENAELCLDRVVNRKFNSDDQVVESSSTFYHQRAQCANPLISYEGKQWTEYLANSLRVINHDKQYDESGILTVDIRRRTTTTYDDNGCVESIISEKGTAAQENNWNEETKSYFEYDGSCSLKSSQVYNSIDQLIRSTTILKDEFGNEVLREQIGYRTDGKVKQITQTTTSYDRFGRRTMQTYKFENFENSIYRENSVEWIYSNLEQPDSIFYYNLNEHEEFKALIVNEYNEDGTERKNTSFIYEGEELDSLVFDRSYETIVLGENHVMTINCFRDFRCTTDEIRNSVTEEENKTILTSERWTYFDNVLSESSTFQTEIYLWCDGAERERLDYHNGELTSVTESYYGHLPSCEKADLLASSSVVPNPTRSGFSIWSGIFNGLETRVTVNDLSGNMIQSIITKNREHYRLNTDGWARGVYLLTIERGELLLNEKVVIL